MSLPQDQKEIVRLIEELPVHNGTIPIDDVTKNGVFTMGAHGKAQEIEGKIAGIAKAYEVSDLLKQIADKSAAGEAIDNELTQIVKTVKRYDGGEKPSENPDFFYTKIDNLDLPEGVRFIIKGMYEASEVSIPTPLFHEAIGKAA